MEYEDGIILRWCKTMYLCIN